MKDPSISDILQALTNGKEEVSHALQLIESVLLWEGNDHDEVLDEVRQISTLIRKIRETLIN